MNCGIEGVSEAPAENHSMVEAIASEMPQDHGSFHLQFIYGYFLNQAFSQQRMACMTARTTI